MFYWVEIVNEREASNVIAEKMLTSTAMDLSMWI